MVFENQEDCVIVQEEEDGSLIYLFQNKLSLTEEEKARLIFHSFTNVLNVLLDTIGKVRVCMNITDKHIFQNSLNIATVVGKSLASLNVSIFFVFCKIVF
jgi:hypothetical protein